MLISLPYPPSVNRIWRRHNGRTLLSRQGRAYRELVGVEVLQAGRPLRPLTCRLSVEMEVIPPDRRQRDLDNLAKAVLDSLEAAGVFENDHQTSWSFAAELSRHLVASMFA